MGARCLPKNKMRLAPELIVDIDVNDEVASRKQPLTADDLAVLVAQLKAQGTQTILVRCGFTGLLPYHTRLSYPMACDPDEVRAFGPHALAPDVEKYMIILATAAR
jgi:hypothetical protein